MTTATLTDEDATIARVAHDRGLDPSDLTGGSQVRRVVAARHEAIRELRRLGMTFQAIAGAMGTVPGTVTYALRNTSHRCPTCGRKMSRSARHPPLPPPAQPRRGGGRT